MTDLPALKRQLIQHENAARARVNAVARVQGFVDEMKGLGLRVEVEETLSITDQRQLQLVVPIDEVAQLTA